MYDLEESFARLSDRELEERLKLSMIMPVFPYDNDHQFKWATYFRAEFVRRGWSFGVSRFDELNAHVEATLLAWSTKFREKPLELADEWPFYRKRLLEREKLELVGALDQVFEKSISDWVSAWRGAPLLHQKNFNFYRKTLSDRGETLLSDSLEQEKKEFLSRMTKDREARDAAVAKALNTKDSPIDTLLIILIALAAFGGVIWLLISGVRWAWSHPIF